MLIRLIVSLAVLIALTTAGFAADISLTETVFERQDPSSVDEPEMLTVHFIDVGGGDGILIDTPSDKKILIDGGYTWSERGAASKEYEAYIDEVLGDDVVDLIVITHPDYDHFAGLPKILETYFVRQVWASGYDSDELSGTWKKFKKALEEDGDTHFLSPLGSFMEIGSEIRFDDGGTFDQADDTVLTLINTQQWLPAKAYGNPERSLNEAQKRNSSSIVLRLDYGATSFLFTGDVNGRKKGASIDAHDDQENFMTDNDNNPDNPLHGLLDVDILKVAHHGSDGSSSLPFLKAVSPTWAVIPAGHPHRHPDDPVLDRLRHSDVALDDDHILRTDEGDTGSGNEQNLGDDTYVFSLDPQGIVKIEKWNITP